MLSGSGTFFFSKYAKMVCYRFYIFSNYILEVQIARIFFGRQDHDRFENL
jgi:hypothetical protein